MTLKPLQAALGALALFASGLVHAERIVLPALDLPKLASEDLSLDGKRGVPLRYGVVHEFTAKRGGPAAPSLEGGGWTTAKDGWLRWSLQIDSTQARNLALYFDAFRLPAGAELRVYADDDKTASLVFTDRDNAPGGDLRTPLLNAQQLRLQLSVPAGLRDATQLRVAEVVQGYRDPFTALNQSKSGSCNIDVACAQGNAWRPQIRSVAHYTFNRGGGSFLCTGQLVATGNPGLDASGPRFLTAHHCLSTQPEAASMTFYWKYESPTCRTPGSAASGNPLSRTISAATQTGANLRATHVPTDFTLVELSAAVPAAADPYYSGWDRSGAVPVGAVGIHHPAGDEKRISIDLDPLTTGPSCIIPGATANTHWFVGAWNSGTTEGGSSGSGIWNPLNQRLVGVLSGGQASCANPNESDCYGALDKAWTGGGSAATRMSDWMNRGAGAPQGIDGYGSCAAPSVSLNSAAFASAPRAGDDVVFTASASGGSGSGYVYEWDLDGDQVFERRGSASSVSLRYPRRLSAQVQLRVTDGSGCPAAVSRALDVVAAQISASAGMPAQVCGNGNAGVDPGERWRLPVTLTNSGNAPLPAGAHALFANALAGSNLPGGIGPNAFGYQATSSAVSPQFCGYSFVDIGSAPALTLTEIDDGRSSVITLGGSGFRLYGEAFTQAVMSTNGYVSFDTGDSGGDWDNSCTGELNRGGLGPRLHVLHDDFVVGSSGALRYQYFASCPRTAASGGAQPCHVFQWDGLQIFNGAAADISFQAVAYTGTGQVAYQYRRADAQTGGSATIGLVDRSGSDPLNAACNSSGSAPASRAVCVFEPQNLPGATAASLLLESPTLALPALAAGASVTLDLPFRVPVGAACSAPIALGYVASAARGQHSSAPSTLLTSQIAAGCSTVSSCPAPASRPAPRRGFFNDPARGGNGLATFLYGDSASPVVGAIWYTGDRSYSSDWYTFAGAWRGGLVEAELFRSRNLQPSGFQPETVATGRAWLATLDSQTQLYAWDFGGGRRGAELMSSTAANLPFSSPDHTNAWIQNGQSGWGIAVESLQLGSGPLEFYGVYLYDSSGASRWLTGTSNSLTGGSLELSSQRIQCPGCPFYPDYASRAQPAGTLQRDYVSRVQMRTSTTITLPAPLSGSWNRSNVTFQAFGESP